MVACLPLLTSLFLGAALPPAEPAPGPEALARSLQAWRSGDLAAAAAALSPDSRGRRCGPPLEPYCAFYRGEALFWSGSYDEAAAELKAARTLDADGPIAARAVAREGEALSRTGRLAEAVARLKEALEHSSAPELRLSLADALQGQGEPAKAIAEWKRIYLESPDHPAAKVALERLKAASADDTLTASELLDRGERLLGAGLPKKALTSILKASGLTRGPNERFRAELDLGKALAALRDGEQAEKILREVAVTEAPQALHIEALLALGRLAMVRNDAKEAAARLDELAGKFPTDPAADEASFLSAWTHFNTGDYAGCAKGFVDFVAQRRSSKRGDDGVWYLGLCSRLAGDKAAAAKAFLELEKTSARLAPQALYWRAHDASPKAAVILFQELSRRAPTSWYGWLARRRLVALGVAVDPFPFTAAEPPVAAPQGEREERAALLVRLGLSRDANDEMGQAIRSVKSADALRLAAACDSLGLFGKSYALANARLWGAAWDRRDPTAMGLLYPRAWPQAVRASAEAVGLDPYFLWAIMRRESAFDPLALSSARAFGLMQLLAPTATKIAQIAGEEPPGLDSLQQPEQILPLAAWYLAELTGRFGDASLAAAGYNGGPRSVARWVSDHGELPLDEFVELIPFKETRLYVKNVLGDYFTYRALWVAPGEPLPFDVKLAQPRGGVAF